MRTLSDYFEEAGLGGAPENILGMVEQIVISHGRTFTGTFYSSFSAHVFRHRLYLGKVYCVSMYRSISPSPPLLLLPAYFYIGFPGMAFDVLGKVCCVSISRSISPSPAPPFLFFYRVSRNGVFCFCDVAAILTSFPKMLGRNPNSYLFWRIFFFLCGLYFGIHNPGEKLELTFRNGVAIGR